VGSDGFCRGASATPPEGTELDERAACAACRLTPPPEDVIMELRSGHRRLRDDPVEIALDTPHRLLEPIDVP
jgi:hypothetical protein